MIDKELLDILACPQTRQPLSEAAADLLARVNRSIEEGKVKNAGGESVSEPLEAGLVRADGRVIYPIRDDIPVLLVDEGIPVG